MKGILLSLLALLMVLGIVIAGCAKPTPAPTPTPTPAPASTPTPAPAPVKPIELKLASTGSSLSWSIKEIFEPWTKEVDLRTNGRVKVTIFPGGALGKENELFDMVRGNAVDIVSVTLKGAGGLFYLPDVYNVPFLLPADPAKAVDKNGVPIDYMLWDKYFTPLELKDVKVLWGVRTSGNAIQMAEKPVRTLDDLKGKLIGMAPGKMLPQMFKAVGASPESVLPTDTYTSLERRLVDGIFYPAELMLNFKLYENMKYMYVVGTGGGPIATMMAPKVWASLPQDIQKIFTDLDIETRAKHLNRWALSDQEAIKVALGKGIEVNYISANDVAKWKEATKNIESDWVASVDAQGLPASQMINEIKQLLAGK